ncbi:MAG: hypothetical protein ACTHN5_13015 [Phycisphaerae bacterium]
MKTSWCVYSLIFPLAIICTATSALADTIKDTLDRARAACEALQDAAKKDLLNAFEAQIALTRQTGDIDAVESLISERKAFEASLALPDRLVMQGPVTKFRRAMGSAESILREAYQSAITDYTKAGKYDDAVDIKKLMADRFLSPALTPNAPSVANPGTAPSDPILADLQAAKVEFVGTVDDAHRKFLKSIEARANAAADAGDLSGYKYYTGLYVVIGNELFLPDNVKNTALRNENAKFVSAAIDAYAKLRRAYEVAISRYTKERRIAEAEAIQDEMKEGGWFKAYTGTPPPPENIDMLSVIDVQRDTIRPAWRLEGGTLEPTGWTDDHGPFIQVPITAKGSYTLQVQFTLANGRDAVYITVPVGQRWGVLILGSAEQSFDNIRGIGEFKGRRRITLNDAHTAEFVVKKGNADNVRFELTVDGKDAMTWAGLNEDVINEGPVWRLQNAAFFGIDTKTGKILRMKLVKSQEE